MLLQVFTKRVLARPQMHLEYGRKSLFFTFSTFENFSLTNSYFNLINVLKLVCSVVAKGQQKIGLGGL